MQDLLVLGIVPGTSFVIPLYFWIVFGLTWILLFWNIDKIHLHRKLQAHSQIQSASTSIATTSTSAGSTLAPILRTVIVKFMVVLKGAAHLVYAIVKEFVTWADKKANSVHASDLKKIMPSKE